KLVDILAALLGSENIAVGAFQNGRISIWDFAKPEHFNLLWKSLGTQFGGGRVLIVWDVTPQDPSLNPINTSDHVSPIHWAACASEFTEEVLEVTMLDRNHVVH